ncbi:MAG: FecR family protein [Flavobacteriaceae bacterium]|nr:FecR family protein [Flavobacteriaceae bacterium]
MNKKETHITDNTFLAKWIANEITDNQLKKLVSEKDFIAYKELQQGVSLYENLEGINEDTYTILKTKLPTKNKTKVRNLLYKWAIPAAAAILVFITITTTYFSDKTTLNKTDYGQNSTIALLDGSEIIINAKSEISYQKDNWKTKREVFLIGEAFFKVKKGSTFTVNTKNGSITVLGTQFNVKSTSGYFEVICYSGKVKVTNNNKEYILNPTQGYRKMNGNLFEDINESDIRPNWLSDETSYKSVPLKYVLKDVENQFDVVFNTKSINIDILFTGSFTHKNKEVAFKTIFKAMELDYKIINNKQVVLSKK